MKINIFHEWLLSTNHKIKGGNNIMSTTVVAIKE